jgi:hypothetical protein
MPCPLVSGRGIERTIGGDDVTPDDFRNQLELSTSTDPGHPARANECTLQSGFEELEE